jgi:hypothetical protein
VAATAVSATGVFFTRLGGRPAFGEPVVVNAELAGEFMCAVAADLVGDFLLWVGRSLRSASW